MPTCKKCGEVVGAMEIKDGLCLNCMPPESAKEIKDNNMMKIKATPEDLAGIKGWLKFLAIILILNFISALLIIFQVIDISNKPNADFLYIASIFSVIFDAYLLYLMFQRKAIFPKVFIWATIIYMVFSIIKDVFLGGPYFEKKDVIGLVILIATNIAWILYMQKSKRVKATFVN